MTIAVIGATGRTGTQVIKQGLARGNPVIALARRPDTLKVRDERLVATRADVLDRDRLIEALDGAEAVVSTLGVGTSRAPTVVYSQGIANVLSAMQANAITRLAVISAAPVGPWVGQPFLERRVAMPILDRLFGATYADMRSMETLLGKSDVDWIALRPPRLVDRPAAGRYRLDTQPLRGARSLTHADLATALLDSLDRRDLYRRAAFVAN